MTPRAASPAATLTTAGCLVSGQVTIRLPRHLNRARTPGTVRSTKRPRESTRTATMIVSTETVISYPLASIRSSSADHRLIQCGRGRQTERCPVSHERVTEITQTFLHCKLG